MNKSIDIIVLGATGFTGKCTVKQLANLTKDKSWDVTWGIAGRSKEKLQNVVKEINEAGITTEELMIIECDIENAESLKNMLQVARVVINCTGPNTLLSPPIVKACIETGTHYVDISAEMFHILSLYRDYHKLAEDHNVLVVPSCGFAVVPAETAVTYLERQFKGTLNTVECYTELFLPSCLPGKAVIHNGTWTSLVYVLENFKKHLALKQSLFPEPIEEEPEEMKRSFFFRNNGQLWFPYPGPDNDLVQISQRQLHEKSRKKPIHFKSYTTVQYFYQFIVVPAIYLYYYLSYFNFFRRLLINFPRLFTLGYASAKGPTYTTRQNTKYSFTLRGKGWAVDDDLKSEPTRTLAVKVSGQDAGYDCTGIAIIMCAITILKEGSNMPKGGVIMPGAAFYNTGIIDRLMRNGLTYEVLN